MRKKVVAVMLSALMALTGLTALGDTTVNAATTGKNATTAVAAKKATKKTATSDKVEVSKTTEGLNSMFPLKKKVTLTYYMAMNSAMEATMKDYNEIQYFKELEKATNVHIKWNHNVNDNSLSLMIAGGELPDMMNASFGAVAGGVPALLKDKVIIDLSKLIPKYAPNYYNWLQNNKEEDKAFKLDDGTLYQFANFNADWDTGKISYFNIMGPQIRKDWLDKLGLEMPKTTDDLFKVLTAFKNNDMNGNGDKGDETPYVISQDMGNNLYTLAGAWGTRKDFHMDGKKIVYGPITDNFKEFLKYAHKLYKNKLINSDFGQNGQATDLVLQNEAGFTISSMGSGVVAAHDALKQTDPNANYVSCPWLAGPDGKYYSTFDRNSGVKGTAITTSCKHPEIAAAWLDYAYSHEGSLNSTFGVEGKSYDIKDNYPTVRTDVRQNKNGWSEEQSMCRWMLGSVNYPNARDFRFYEQINLNEDYKKDLQKNWEATNTDITMPPLVMTSAETKKFSSIMSDITTYTDESITKFIMGDLSLDKDWDSYVKNIKGMGIADAQKCKEAAYARYQKR